ncbi:UNVERIFIED_CONTAM: Pseudouridylate synthase 7 [Sesamum latifolium]|uniref:Pseudouridylate synthase 7 n=1 Tax=Sesamum latifolium TaxID=2727402 RepID=A0AAW2YEI2_9LAMI
MCFGICLVPSFGILLKRKGFHQVVLGDLVYSKEQEAEKELTSSHLECKDGSGCDTDVDYHLDDISLTDLSELRNTSVKVITEEDIVAGKYTIYDIVLPLPGSRIIYPMNDIGEVYHELAKKDDISLIDSLHKHNTNYSTGSLPGHHPCVCFISLSVMLLSQASLYLTTMTATCREFSLTNMTGAYRQVFQKPKDFQWELLNYTDVNKPLAETDWDIIAKSCAASFGRDSDEKEQIKLQTSCRSEANKFKNEVVLSPDTTETKSDREEDIQIEEPIGASKTPESQMALKLSFTLPASSYATMAIRELLKTSTSVSI